MAHKRKETLWPTSEKKHYGPQGKRNTMAHNRKETLWPTSEKKHYGPKRKETLAHKQKQTLRPTSEKKHYGQQAKINTNWPTSDKIKIIFSIESCIKIMSHYRRATIQ